MKKIINAYIYGIGIGGIIYSACLLLSDVTTQSISNIVSCLLISGFMGIASLIYNLEQIPFIYQNVIHFISISGLVFLMNSYNGWLSKEDYLSFFIQFFIIYLIVWIIVSYLNYSKTSIINKKLAERQASKTNH
ncbi:DUF3021 domain-containing protein [Streptococcus hongkongensis]|nr:membrane protein [Streptococcus uberis]